MFCLHTCCLKRNDGQMNGLIMAEASNRTRASSWGLVSNYRYLCRKAMMLRAMDSATARKKHQRMNRIDSLKRKRTDSHKETLDTNKMVKKTISCLNHTGQDSQSTQNSEGTSTDVSETGQQVCHLQISESTQPKGADHQRLATALGDSWDVDSGFCSETSPPASGRSSPCLFTPVVAMDCEMVGTGPGGCCSELARCSIVDYHGNVLYDKYIRPCQPVMNYRTRWSGIQSHHLCNATPFAEAREEILGILQGKVVVGHSLHNDFKALDMNHPGHMVRDTATTRLLRRLAGFPRKHCCSLKILAYKLLDRRIQTGKKGHCSVQDAQAALDLYKLVEEDWERQLQERLGGNKAAPENHYMQDQYWPEDLTVDSQ